jgi:hypothetical protein
MLPKAVQRVDARPNCHAANQHMPAKRAFRPSAIGLVGLAIAVALWGFSYRLSRYTFHPDTLTRASVAKLWDKHQDAGQVIASKLNAPPQSQLDLHVLLISLQNAQEPHTVAFCEPDVAEAVSSPFRSLFPSRSPPSRSSQE